jgi:hypothetical protein
MGDLLKKQSEELAVQADREDFAALCERREYNAASNLMDIDEQVQDAVSEGEISVLEGFRLRMEANKALLPFQYTSKRSSNLDVGGDNVTNVTITNFNLAGEAPIKQQIVDITQDG